MYTCEELLGVEMLDVIADIVEVVLVHLVQKCVLVVYLVLDFVYRSVVNILHLIDCNYCHNRTV